IMPALGGVPYRHWTYSSLGSGPIDAALNVLRNPLRAIELLFIPLAKMRLWIASFGSWLFLPLLSPLTLVALPSFVERFWNGPDFWTFHMQYSMLSAPILAFAAIDGVARIKSFRWASTPVRLTAQLAVTSFLITAVLTVAINPPADPRRHAPGRTGAR